MQAKGYVTRTAHAADERVERLGLSPRGRAALGRAREFHARCEQALVDRLGALAAAESGMRLHRPRPA